MENIRQRLQAFLDYKEIKAYRAENESGIATSSLSRFLKGKDMGIENLMKIHIKYPDLNLDWLFRGEGEMLFIDKSNMLLEVRIDEMVAELKDMKMRMKARKTDVPYLPFSKMGTTNKTTNQTTNESKRKNH